MRHNWIGLFGAYLSDLLLQSLGLTAFLLPLWMGGVGWTWMRSRPSGSALLRWMGTLLALAFVPAVFGLLPWHWRWMHVVPVEGVVGRLMAGLLVIYLNIQGAWLVAARAGRGRTLLCLRHQLLGHQGKPSRSLAAASSAWHDRWRTGARSAPNRRRAQADAKPTDERAAKPPVRRAALSRRPCRRRMRNRLSGRPGLFARLLQPPAARAESDPLDEIPAYQRASATGIRAARSQRPAAERDSHRGSARRTSIWERAEADARIGRACTRLRNLLRHNVDSPAARRLSALPRPAAPHASRRCSGPRRRPVPRRRPPSARRGDRHSRPRRCRDCARPPSRPST